jgi:hypothetical protein
LIINLASLRPIAEDVLEAKSYRFRKAPAMVAALTFQLGAPDSSDPS